jgi:hypothetical protein
MSSTAQRFGGRSLAPMERHMAVDSSGPILDYASPRPASKLRLPARSVLHCEQSVGALTLVETLEVKGDAIGAILFAIFVLGILSCLIAPEIGTLIRLRRFSLPGPILVLGLLWVAEFATVLIVIDQTWRQTVLDASSEGLCLVRTSPFRTRRMLWHPDQVVELRVVHTALTRSLQALGQLQIFLSTGQTVHLFTDHPKQELDWFTGLLADALKRSDSNVD